MPHTDTRCGAEQTIRIQQKREKKRDNRGQRKDGQLEAQRQAEEMRREHALWVQKRVRAQTAVRAREMKKIELGGVDYLIACEEKKRRHWDTVGSKIRQCQPASPAWRLGMGRAHPSLRA